MALGGTRAAALDELGSYHDYLEMQDEARARDRLDEVRRLDRELPEGWRGIARANPRRRAKTRVTLRLDADVAAWFRETGPGHQTRMNAVLRCYMLAREAEVV